MSKNYVTERLEDMSPNGKLTLIRQEDGDIVVVITQGDDSGLDSNPGMRCQVEFCTHAGGGGSPRTRRALQSLMVAMAKDNESPNHAARKPELLADQAEIADW